MAIVTLKPKGPRSIMTLGVVFVREVPERVDAATARTLQVDDRFLVEFEPGETEVTGVVDAGVPVVRTKPESMTQRLQMIRDAADELSVDVEENFTSDGKPSAIALTKALGWQVTKEDRDRAMSISQANEQLAREKSGGTTTHTGGVTIRRSARVEPLPLLDTGAAKTGDQAEDPTIQGAVSV